MGQYRNIMAKLPFFKWSYVYKENLYDFFIKKINQIKLIEPYFEEDIFSIFKKMTGQETRSKTYKSFIMLLELKKVKIRKNEYE